MHTDLRPGEIFACEECQAVYAVMARGSVDSIQEARCACCGTVIVGWPEEYGFELIKPSYRDIA